MLLTALRVLLQADFRRATWLFPLVGMSRLCKLMTHSEGFRLRRAVAFQLPFASDWLEEIVAGWYGNSRPENWSVGKPAGVVNSPADRLG